jgi:hypothetical protein
MSELVNHLILRSERVWGTINVNDFNLCAWLDRWSILTDVVAEDGVLLLHVHVAGRMLRLKCLILFLIF